MKPCAACRHVDVTTLDRLLLMDGVGAGGKRGPRSLAPVFGLDRRDIARHAKRCLVGERREKLMGRLWTMAEATDPLEAVGAHRRARRGGSSG